MKHNPPQEVAGIRAAARAWSLGYRVMLGLDGTSIDDATEAAFTPTGPPREVLRELIRERRGVAA